MKAAELPDRESARSKGAITEMLWRPFYLRKPQKGKNEKMKNKTEEVKKQIAEMKEKKAAELEQIRERQTEAQTQKEAAEAAIKEATAEMNLPAFEAAGQEKRKAQAALDMYQGKFKQIQQQEYVTEEQSDKVIADLLEYEEALADEFKQQMQEHIEALERIHREYTTAIRETEETIKTWEREIHANYRSQTATYADGTNRSPLPVPVRAIPFIGCAEALKLGDFLEKIARK